VLADMRLGSDGDRCGMRRTVVDDYVGLSPLLADCGEGRRDGFGIGEVSHEMQSFLPVVLALRRACGQGNFVAFAY